MACVARARRMLGAREKREGREGTPSSLASLSRALVLSGANITFMGLLRWRQKALRVNSTSLINRRAFSDFFTSLMSML